MMMMEEGNMVAEMVIMETIEKEDMEEMVKMKKMVIQLDVVIMEMMMKKVGA